MLLESLVGMCESVLDCIVLFQIYAVVLKTGLKQNK